MASLASLCALLWQVPTAPVDWKGYHDSDV